LAYDLTHWMTFLAAAILLNLSPGPDIAFILGHTVKGGARAGTAAMLGIWLGTFGHIVFAVSGLSALLAASAMSFPSSSGSAWLTLFGSAYNRSAHLAGPCWRDRWRRRDGSGGSSAKVF
jgi:threonine/homoserine/homoserine lactone efflux protein